ncbi:MAG: helix-turn-helix domain-containing protein [Halobacteria archaeon]
MPSKKIHPGAELRLKLPEDTWISQISRGHSTGDFRVLAALAKDSKGAGLLEIQSDEIDEINKEIQSHREIETVEILESRSEHCLLQFETTNPLLLFAAQESGVPLETPLSIKDGEALWQLNLPRRKLSDLTDQLDNFGIEYEVEYVKETQIESLLTERQRKLVEKAIAEGYYETPRDASLTEVADSLGMAKSTCSEILHRAESKIIKESMEFN